MAEITLHAELPQNANAQELARQIQERVAGLSEVDEVEAAPESTRLAAEIIAGIAVTVSIVKGTGEIADALHQAIPKIKRVLEDLGLRNATVEVAGELVPAGEISRSDTQKMIA
jgi:hypothetical protein